MTNDPDSGRREDDMPEPENVLDEYDRIQKQLGEGFAEDPRLASGVPQDERGSDFEFIQMSGLVRPSAIPGPNAASSQSDLDPSRPVSFFEKGVVDVDAAMVPGSIEDPSVANQEICPVQQTQAAMSHLRDIIADLTKDAPCAATDPHLMASLGAQDAPDTPSAGRPSAPEESAREPVSLEDVLSECVPTHPMQQHGEAVAPDQTTAAAAEIVCTGPAAPPAEAEVPEQMVPVLHSHSAQLAEAEKLLEELEPEDTLETGSLADRAHEPAPFGTPGQPDETFDIPDEALDYKKQSRRRHRSPGKTRVARTFFRTAAGIVAVSAMAVSIYAGYLWVQGRMTSPRQLFNQAARLAAQGDYEGASRLYESFASLHPGDPLRPDAQFNAAFAMQEQHPGSADRKQEVMRQALRLFEAFRNDNPSHPKVPRAETIMGVLNYESGRYREAIDLLRNPELRLRDPASAVPALRTLARASAKLNDAEAARSYYLQAAGVQDNHSPDVDYAELGSLYQSRADLASGLDKRIELQQLAIDSWTHALEVPGIDPASKTTIRSQLDVLRERLQSEPGMAPAMESLDDAAVMDSAAIAAGPLVAQPAEPAAPSGDAGPGAATTAVPAPNPMNRPEGPGATEGGEYVVKSGDTLASIAKSLHATVDELKDLNALTGDGVFEGQHLIVPAAQP